MIYPSIAELSEKTHINRYTLVIATAKCARMITDDYIKQKELAERMAGKEADKGISPMLKPDSRNEKAVQDAIEMLYEGEYQIVERTLPDTPGQLPARGDDTDKAAGSEAEAF